jgi:CubicO group peptidase (beta-lactamase class C family)
MKNSGFYALNEPPKNTAIGYQKNRKTTNIYNIPIRGGGDGGMFTNTYDLNAFWQHLFSNRILNEELTDEFLKTQWKFNDKRGYGYGIYKELDDSMFYIVGGDAGVGFISRCLPKRNLVINILSNVTDQGDSISQLIMANL